MKNFPLLFSMNFKYLKKNVFSFCSSRLIEHFKDKLDWGSIRSSPGYGLSSPYRLTIRNSARLFHHVLFNMADLVAYEILV